MKVDPPAECGHDCFVLQISTDREVEVEGRDQMKIIDIIFSQVTIRVLRVLIGIRHRNKLIGLFEAIGAGVDY